MLNVLVFRQSTPFSCQVSVKLGFTRHSFQKNSTVKFHGKTASKGRVVPCGQTGRNNKVSSRSL